MSRRKAPRGVAVASWPRPGWATTSTASGDALTHRRRATGVPRLAEAAADGGRTVDVVADQTEYISSSGDGAVVIERVEPRIHIGGLAWSVAGARELAAVLVALADTVEGVEGAGPVVLGEAHEDVEGDEGDAPVVQGPGADGEPGAGR